MKINSKFYRGFVSALTIFPMTTYNTIKFDFSDSSDKSRLAKDWLMVANDMNKAINTYEQKTQLQEEKQT